MTSFHNQFVSSLNAFHNHLFNCILQNLTKIMGKLHEEEGNLL